MDENVRSILNVKLENTKKALLKNNMNAEILEDRAAVQDYLKSNIKEGSIVSIGGSQSLKECDGIQVLSEMPITFINPFKDDLSGEEKKKLYREAFMSDYYITSSNAITETGELYNVDGNGNRVSAMIFGPEHVILVVGENKIVRDMDAAVNRVREIAAPMNVKRLNKKTACDISGTCLDCQGPDRICSSYVRLGKQSERNKGRITVLLVKESLGY